MTHNLTIKQISLSHIDFNDYTYCLNPFQEPQISESLRNSISMVGVLHPPILKEIYTNCYQIIAGRARLLIVRDTLARKDCSCMILDQRTDQETIFSILLEESIASRPINVLEQAVFIHKICNEMDIQFVTQNFMPKMGLSQHQYHIQKAETLLDLEKPLLKSIEKGILNEKIALELAKLPFKDRMAIYEIIKDLTLSIGKQKKLLTISKELSKRTRNSIADILSGDEIREILNHPEANIPQKGSNLMKWLNKKRSPDLCEAEKKFNTFINSLNLPKQANLSHSLSFEKDTLNLTLQFKNETDFLMHWQRIKKSLESGQ